MTAQTTPTPESVKALADGLTEAQREAIVACWQNAERHAPYHMFGSNAGSRAAWRSMLALGFVTKEGDGHDLVITRGKPTAMVCLTQLGLAVRAHLSESQS